MATGMTTTLSTNYNEIIAKIERGNLEYLYKQISNNKDIDPKIASSLLKTQSGTNALAQAFEGKEEEALFLLDTLNNSEDREYFIDTILYKIASQIKNSGNYTDPKEKINSIKVTINKINDFLISLFSLSNKEIIDETLENLGGEDIILDLMSETKIDVDEEEISNLEIDPDEIGEIQYNHNPTYLHSGFIFSPDQLVISGKNEEKIRNLLESLFDNYPELYANIIEQKINLEEKESPITVYMKIKERIEKYEKKYDELGGNNNHQLHISTEVDEQVGESPIKVSQILGDNIYDIL